MQSYGRITLHFRPAEWLILSALHRTSTKTAAERIARWTRSTLRLTGQMMLDGSLSPARPGHLQSPKRSPCGRFMRSTPSTSARRNRSVRAALELTMIVRRLMCGYIMTKGDCLPARSLNSCPAGDFGCDCTRSPRLGTTVICSESVGRLRLNSGSSGGVGIEIGRMTHVREGEPVRV